ncbi:pyruvate, water dikinase regulatory protein [Adlercreutzia agrestimuris]|uniref:pyruvate, water dikinase regulatory protein n=1 Tax=Adlercreutzia agrestimuris TaxID=2941324 RepID=UPI00203C5C24|nr:pyruvate, water dikinase regulatory protein [Adlercreutzia agrestimuris]
MKDVVIQENNTPLPTVHVISDSVGLTAQAVARAACAQFGVTNPAIEVLPKVRSLKEVQEFVETHVAYHKAHNIGDRILVFYTLVDNSLSHQVHEFLESREDVIAVDLMTDAIHSIAEMSGLEPADKPGSMHVADRNYFKRIEAIEFTIAHDDGRNPQDLTKADIVLLGVSRSSKTPTSIYLAQQGYKVANIPLDPDTEPPVELFEVERSRLFGLMITPDVLIGIRQRRLGRAGAVAGRYADPQFISEDLTDARALMRQLGAIVVHTENRAVEETAQEILRYYEKIHPRSSDVDE